MHDLTMGGVKNNVVISSEGFRSASILPETHTSDDVKMYEFHVNERRVSSIHIPAQRRGQITSAHEKDEKARATYRGK